MAGVVLLPRRLKASVGLSISNVSYQNRRFKAGRTVLSFSRFVVLVQVQRRSKLVPSQSAPSPYVFNSTVFSLIHFGRTLPLVNEIALNRIGFGS